MPAMDERELKKSITSKNFKNAYLIYGEEAYLKQYYSNLLAQKCVNQGMEGFNLKKLQGDTTTIDEILSTGETLPTFSDYLCVLVNDFPLDTLTPTEKEDFECFIKDIPETTIMIFWQGSAEINLKKNAKWRGLVELFNKYGASICFDKLDKNSLSKVLISGATKRKCEIDKVAAFYLIDMVGDDLNILQSEMDKLCNYKSEGNITKSDIDTVCTKSLEATVFDLSKMIVAGNISKAFSILNMLLSQKEKPELILGALISAYVDMYRVKLSLAAGEKLDYCTNFFNYRNIEFRLRNAARDAKNLTIQQLRKSLDELNKADKQIKTRVIEEKTIIEKLIIELVRIG
ncbi:MAG: DNA polymerase III subunit delta [Oscillospiraceae bacterium]